MKRFLASALVVLSIFNSTISLAGNMVVLNKGENIIRETTSKNSDILKRVAPEKEEVNFKESIFQLESIGAYYKDDILMLPLRRILEKQEYEISWDNRLRQINIQKNGIFTSLKPKLNLYFHGDKLPTKLSSYPEIKKAETYVPVDFFKELLKLDIQEEEGYIIVTEREIKKSEEMEIEGYIKDISKDGYILLGVKRADLELSEVIIYIGDKTEILSEDGEEVSRSKLVIGDRVQVVTPRFLAMSMPPQTLGKKIRVYGEKSYIKVRKGNVNYLLSESSEEVNKTINKFIDQYYENSSYEDLKMDFIVSYLDSKVLSLVFNGEFSHGGEPKEFRDVLNIDLETGRQISINSYFKNDEKSQKELYRLLEKKVGELYGKEFQAEGLNMYFTEESLNIFYYELDHSVIYPVEVSLKYEEIKNIVKK